MSAKLPTFLALLFSLTCNSGSVATAQPLTLRFQKATTPPGAKEPKGDDVEKKKYRGSLSGIAVAAGGQVMFLGGDETVGAEPTLERLTRQSDGSYGEHQPVLVSGFIALPDATDDEGRKGEIDIEALAVADGYLWFVGSHSYNRKQPKRKPEEALGKLGTVEEGKNRFFLGRIPVTDMCELVKVADTHTAGKLVGGGPDWNLLQELAQDTHLGPFLVPFDSDGKKVRLPSKDNGFDIEGLAVTGNRVLLGLRGPVLRGWACVLEINVQDKGGEGDFELAAPAGAPRYRKHFLDLGGLGIRDLLADGADLHILCGPTMALDGPARLVLWKGAFKTMETGDTATPAKQLVTLKDLVVGTGDDHPEGIALLPETGSGAKKMIIVFDSPANSRLLGETNVNADVLSLP